MQREPLLLVLDSCVAGRWRARLGPRAWCVLEVLAATAPAGAGLVDVACSSRSVAAQLGVSRDSAARSLRVLIDTGLVTRAVCRDDATGRFGAATYRVDVAAAGLRVVTASHLAAPANPVADARPRTPPDARQPSLFH